MQYFAPATCEQLFKNDQLMSKSGSQISVHVKSSKESHSKQLIAFVRGIDNKITNVTSKSNFTNCSICCLWIVVFGIYLKFRKSKIQVVQKISQLFFVNTKSAK